MDLVLTDPADPWLANVSLFLGHWWKIWSQHRRKALIKMNPVDLRSF